jgi:hypothetical protein
MHCALVEWARRLSCQTERLTFPLLRVAVRIDSGGHPIHPNVPQGFVSSAFPGDMINTYHIPRLVPENLMAMEEDRHARFFETVKVPAAVSRLPKRDIYRTLLSYFDDQGRRSYSRAKQLCGPSV